MAKGTNTSRCPGQDRDFKSGSTIRRDTYHCNDGFILKYSVNLSGFELTDNQIKALSSVILFKIQSYLDTISSKQWFDHNQLEFSFDGLC